MKIALSPQRRDDTLEVSLDGDILSLNGQLFDLTGLPDGATLPADAVTSQWITGPVERINGEIHLTLIAPHGKDASEAARFPQPLTVASGRVELPR